MTVSEWIAGKLLDPLWEKTKQQWKGFVIGSVIVAAILIYNYKPIVDKHFDLGNFVGTYTIVKGEDVTVSRGELNVNFEDQTYRRLRKASVDSPQESIFVYPVFEFYPRGMYENTKIEKFKIGQRYTFNSELYLYIIELESLEHNSSDTSATVNIFRREYPKIRKDQK